MTISLKNKACDVVIISIMKLAKLRRSGGNQRRFLSIDNQIVIAIIDSSNSSGRSCHYPKRTRLP